MILRDMSASVPAHAPIADGARLPDLVDSQPPLHVGFLIMLGLCVFVWFVLQRTTNGFEIRMVGANPHAARCTRASASDASSCLVMAHVRRVRRARRRGRDRRNRGLPQPGRVPRGRLRLDRDRAARPRQPVRDRPRRDPVGLDARGRAADAAGDGPLHRHRAHRAGARAAVRRGRRDRAHDLPHPQRRPTGAFEEPQLGTEWGGTAHDRERGARRAAARGLGRFQIIGLFFGVLGVDAGRRTSRPTSSRPTRRSRSSNRPNPAEHHVRPPHDRRRDRGLLRAHRGRLPSCSGARQRAGTPVPA